MIAGVLILALALTPILIPASAPWSTPSPHCRPGYAPSRCSHVPREADKPMRISLMTTPDPGGTAGLRRIVSDIGATAEAGFARVWSPQLLPVPGAANWERHRIHQDGRHGPRWRAARSSRSIHRLTLTGATGLTRTRHPPGHEHAAWPQLTMRPANGNQNL